jgi:hypothetical protein
LKKEIKTSRDDNEENHGSPQFHAVVTCPASSSFVRTIVASLLDDSAVGDLPEAQLVVHQAEGEGRIHVGNDPCAGEFQPRKERQQPTLSSVVASHLTQDIRPKVTETFDKHVALLKQKEGKRKKD